MLLLVLSFVFFVSSLYGKLKILLRNSCKESVCWITVIKHVKLHCSINLVTFLLTCPLQKGPVLFILLLLLSDNAFLVNKELRVLLLFQKWILWLLLLLNIQVFSERPSPVVILVASRNLGSKSLLLKFCSAVFELGLLSDQWLMWLHKAAFCLCTDFCHFLIPELFHASVVFQKIWKLLYSVLYSWRA